MDEINPTVSFPNFSKLCKLYEFTEKAEFPYHLIPKIAALGISGLDTPKSMGG